MPLVNATMALEALGIEGFSLYGAPETEAEFNSMFVRVLGYDQEDHAIETNNPAEIGVTWSDVSAKMAELEAAEPLRLLREERNRLLAETDWWASSDLTMTAEQTAYRQALRDITETYTSLEDVVWPTKP